MPITISVIVTTYNWPQALQRVLCALTKQSYPHFEIIVADDGSDDTTAVVIQNMRSVSHIPIIHCWQPDEGFQAAKCRNKAVARAKNDYIIFIDGDCVPMKHFVAHHAKLAEQAWFVGGNRVLLSEKFTEKVLHQELPIEQLSFQQRLTLWLLGRVNRLAGLTLPLGKLRKISPDKWRGVKTCNLAIWRSDFIAVNGFNEEYIGWGLEDSDLVIRLQRLGVKRKLGKFSVEVLHLWHPLATREQLDNNQQHFSQICQNKQVEVEKGIGQYLNNAHH